MYDSTVTFNPRVTLVKSLKSEKKFTTLDRPTNQLWLVQ